MAAAPTLIWLGKYVLLLPLRRRCLFARTDRSRSRSIDCDPGHDDAFALLLAGHNPKVKLLGVSTVGGNVPVTQTTQNARNIMAVGGMAAVPVVVGVAKPLVRPAVHCHEIHGGSGLDGHHFPPLPAESRLLPGKAVTEMFHAIQAQAPARVTLVATGPLTNVALLLSVYPEVKEHLTAIVLMGGALGVGNTGPVAEFNIQVDPEAAHIVFQSGLVTMVPVEVRRGARHHPAPCPLSAHVGVGVGRLGGQVTHTALVTRHVLADMEAALGSTPFAVLLRDLLLFFAQTYRDVFGFADPVRGDHALASFRGLGRKRRQPIRCPVRLAAARSVRCGVRDCARAVHHQDDACRRGDGQPPVVRADGVRPV